MAERPSKKRVTSAWLRCRWAGGSRVLPMSSITGGITVEQADALVAQLRNG